MSYDLGALDLWAKVPPARTELVGRDAELAVVREFVASLGQAPKGLLLTGDPGIGKTTLWSAAVVEARSAGATVLVTQPAASDRELPFAGLNDLVGALLDEHGPTLPPPRRRSLESALLRAEADSPSDRLAVSLAVLDILRLAAAERPVVIAVDDLQWLDAPTATAVDFSLRRLADAPVSLLCTSRPERTVSLVLGMPEVIELPVGPLSLDELGRIVCERGGARPSRLTLLRLHALCTGNPLFALEVARALPAIGEDGPLSVPETLSELVRERLEPFRGATRRALLVVAALGRPSIRDVAAAVPDWRMRLDKAIAAGVIDVADARVGFTHPVLSSSVYENASPRERRRVHRLLADVLEDPDQVARHLAHASDEPDEEIAAALTAAATRVAARGAPETAVELAAHARRLTPPGDVTAEATRGVLAAGYVWSAGDGARSRLELERLIESSAPPTVRAQARQLLVKIIDDMPTTISHLERAYEEASGDATLQASVRNLLSRQRMWAGDFNGAAADARAAAELARAAGSREQLAVALAREALVEANAGLAIPYHLLGAAIEIESSLADPIPVGESPTRIYGACALFDDDLETARRFTEVAERQAASRSESWRAVVLDTLAEIEIRQGDAPRALAHVQEAQEIGRYWGVGHAEAATLASGALIRAIVGRIDDARHDAVRALELMRPAGYDVVVSLAERALGLAELSVGNAERAHAALVPLLARARPTSATAAAAADDVEALVELGRVEEAQAVFSNVDACGRPRAAVALARCRALIAAATKRIDEAADLAAGAVTLGERLGEPLETGRTLLVQGVIERRRKKKASARIALERAVAEFEVTSAGIWAERARAELLRTGAKQTPRDELTPTEARVAELASRGATNREIAEHMFISVKTVEANLSRIYGKLNVRSRTELAARAP
jgi:DNA-binding CsgD family transcriptional regulator